MRELRVLGLADSGATLVCEDPEDGEQFEIPRDEKLRAAARGDASRFGQLEIEGDSQLRPREIQARIRAGAGIEEIAALAGTSIRRIESFAHPVLLERLTMSEKARKGRPSIDGITAGTSVEEMVTGILAARGQDAGMTWDAYREDEQWILVLRWNVGRSENRARWTYHPGPAGGTLTARDDAAAEIVDPALRVLRPIREGIRSTRGSGAGTAPAGPARSAAPDLLDPTRPTSSPPGARQGTPTKSQAHREAPEAAATPVVTGEISTVVQVSQAVQTVETVEVVEVAEVVVATGTAGPAPRAAGPVQAAAPKPAAPKPVAPKSAAPAPAAPQPVAKSASPSAGPRGARRPSRPAMPSWEDVLLGTRSPGRD